ncbi:MAG: nickel pincer cofactor biosynthesis protein LarC [Chloroflexota bacterium]
MIAYFDCFSGASGDMILGSLLDAGLELADLEEQLATLRVPGYRLQVERLVSKGITGTRFHIALDEPGQEKEADSPGKPSQHGHEHHDHIHEQPEHEHSHEHSHAHGAQEHDRGHQHGAAMHSHDHPQRNLPAILGLIAASGLSATAKDRASAIFRRLGEAEATIHGVSVDEIHFHEVGAVDAIVDICGAVVGLELLGVTEVYCSALPTGGGTIRSAHGLLPVPAPATLELLRLAKAPLRPVEVAAEMVTPTGAAILTTLGQFRQPSLRLARVGYGFGSKELPWANTLRVWLGEASDGLQRDVTTLIEANIDDMPAELLSAAMERLFAAGALDVYFTPIQMKKNRPAVMLSVIAPEERTDELAGVVLAETTTLGVRLQPLTRVKCERWQERVETPFGPVLAKAKRLGDRVTLAPEFDDAARLARERHVPLADVYAAVAAASLARQVPPTTSA